MSTFSGLSAILTVSLVALVTVQMLKDKFEMIENYGEHDDNGNNMNTDYMQPYTTQDVSTAREVQEVAEALPIHAQNLSDLPKHGLTPFVAGDYFGPPFVGQDKNGWNGFSESFAMYKQAVNNATPDDNQLRSIGSQTVSLPGPNAFGNDLNFSPANVNTGRAANLTLCSQNANTNAVGNYTVASSLLPSPNKEGGLEGFSDCNPTNTLANQVFLSASGQAGTNTISGSNKNQSYDLRSAPPNPVLIVSPWMNSTIYPDLTRRPIEGCGPSFGLYGNGPNSGGTPTKIYS